MAGSLRFPSTLWSRISLAKRQDTKAVHQFVDRYRPPVLRYIRKAGLSEQDAEDLAQEVFSRLLVDEVLERADRERGRFRSFVLGVTRNVIREAWEKRRAAKRGGGWKEVDVDPERVSAGPDPSEEEFDRGWLEHLIETALEALEKENPELHRTLSGHILDGKSYEALAKEGGKSLASVRNSIHRARQRLVLLIQGEIARYASSSDEFADEVRYLSRFMR